MSSPVDYLHKLQVTMLSHRQDENGEKKREGGRKERKEVKEKEMKKKKKKTITQYSVRFEQAFIVNNYRGVSGCHRI